MIQIISVQHTGTWFVIDLFKLVSKPIKHVHLYAGGGEVAKADKVKHRHPNKILKNSRKYWNIVPIRDPLAAILTRQARMPYLKHEYIIHGFIWLAENFADNPLNAFFIPIDLLATKTMEQRLKYIGWVFEDLGLEMKDEVNDYVMGWQAPEYNVSRWTGFKADYHVGNYPALKAALPEETALLESNRDVLEPFMRDLGYKNLMWFNKEGGKG